MQDLHSSTVRVEWAVGTRTAVLKEDLLLSVPEVQFNNFLTLHNCNRTAMILFTADFHFFVSPIVKMPGLIPC